MSKTLTFIALLFLIPACAHANVIWHPRPLEQFSFGHRFPRAQSLLFAFDYGHALIYGRLLKLKRNGKLFDRSEEGQKVLAEEGNQIFEKVRLILAEDHTFKASEEIIAPLYANLFNYALSLFDWSHYLHQFTYDILSSNLDKDSKLKRMAQVYAQYREDYPGLVITDKCLSMKVMNSQTFRKANRDVVFSKSFRQLYRELNELIWSYHWLQIAIYKGLLKPTESEQTKTITEIVALFQKKVELLDPQIDEAKSKELDHEFTQLSSDPKLKNSLRNLIDMPKMEGLALEFSRLPGTAEDPALFAHIANVFDNLHMLHDLISDLLTSEEVPFNALASQSIKFSTMIHNPDKFPEEKITSSDCLSEQRK